MDKNATSVRIHHRKLIVAKQGNVIEVIDLPSSLKGNLNFFCVFNHVHIIQIGDLMAQFTLQGRAGMAQCRCLHCAFTQAEWTAAIKEVDY